MKRERDNTFVAENAFDEIADLDHDAPLTVADIREAAGLLGALVTQLETDAACDRVRSRLFPESAGSATARSMSVRLAVPDWLAVAAAIALFVTGLAVFRVLPLGTETASQAVAVVDPSTITLIFPDEAVIDARLACLEADLDAIADESFWKVDDDPSLFRSEQ